jgi:hypothetical protein
MRLQMLVARDTVAITESLTHASIQLVRYARSSLLQRPPSASCCLAKQPNQHNGQDHPTVYTNSE